MLDILAPLSWNSAIGGGDRPVVVIGGEALRVTAGQVVLMPANAPRAVNARGQFKMLLTMLKGESE
ncbi:MAG: hypothetical protein ABII12_09675 [Planctomycetota bacterium]